MKMYQPGDKVYYNNRGKALCLAVIGKKGVKRGVRIAAGAGDGGLLVVGMYILLHLQFHLFTDGIFQINRKIL